MRLDDVMLSRCSIVSVSGPPTWRRARPSTTAYSRPSATRLRDFGVAIGWGARKPDFWISTCDHGEGFRESHIAFSAADRATVHAFFDAAT